MKQVAFITDRWTVHESVLAAVSRAAEENNAKTKTLVRLEAGSSVTHQLWLLLNESDLVVADISGKGAGVFYEVGLAHGLGKPVVLISESGRSLIPFDLASQMVVLYSETTEGLDKLTFTLSQIMQQDPGGMKVLEGPSRAVSDVQVTDSPIEFEFRSILELDPQQRRMAFTRWFAQLIRSIPEWEVIESATAGRDKGFDFAFWNSLEDTELSILGNPIVVELKSTPQLTMAVIQEFVRSAETRGVRAALLATVATATSMQRTQVRNLAVHRGLLLVLLDHSDLSLIRSPSDLVARIKLRLVELLAG